MHSTKIFTLVISLAAISGVCQAFSSSDSCYTGTSGVYVQTSCSAFTGSIGCSKTIISGVATKSCLIGSLNSTCGTNVPATGEVFCCYSSLCNSAFKMNMYPLHLFIILASYLYYMFF